VSQAFQQCNVLSSRKEPAHRQKNIVDIISRSYAISCSTYLLVGEDIPG
jgi:hypothetical protein